MSSDEGSDDREFDDEDDGSEEEDYGSRKKSKSNRPSNPFIESEAVEDSDEEDDEPTDGGKWVDPLTKVQQHRRHKNIFEGKTAEELVDHFDRTAYIEDEYGSDEDDEGGEIRKQSLLPAVTDPKLWMVKCKPGKERHLAVVMMQKFLDTYDSPERLLIKSVVCPDHLKGYVYIEADKEVHVKNAIKNMRLFQSFEIKLVPMKEMPEILTVTRKNANLKRGDWVRVKRGLYRGDIAQVNEYYEAKGEVELRIIPRIDPNAAPTTNDESEDKTKRKRAPRPPQRFLSLDDIGQVKEGGRGYNRYNERTVTFNGDRFTNGFLIKIMNIKSLEVNGVQPTPEEYQKFQVPDSEEGGDAPISSGGLTKKKVKFVKGDVVKVIEGELKHLTGVVDSVIDDTVTIAPKHDELKDLLAFPASQLQKFFENGNHVKILSGKNEGETGMIVKVEENTVTIFSDLTGKELKVPSQDVQECSDTVSAKVALGGYDLHDLVAIGTTVGVIVKVEKDSFKILDTNGTIQPASLSNIGRKRNMKDATSFDSNQNQIGIEDVVKVLEGKYKERQGTIKHLFKIFAFLHSRDMAENSGMFVVRTSQLALLGGKSRASSGGNMGISSVPQSPRNSGFGGNPLRSPQRGNTNQRDSRQISTPNRKIRNDRMLGKTVKIRKGQWKGYVGIVKDATETTLRIELHTKPKIITIAKDSVDLVNLDGSTSGSSSWGDSRQNDPYAAMQTPLRQEDVTATPLRAPSTPSRTPLHGTVWDPSVLNTPSRSENNWSSWGSNADYAGGLSTPGSSYSYSTPSTSYSTTSHRYSDEISQNPATPQPYTPHYDTPNFTPNYPEVQRTPADVSTPYGPSSSIYHPTTPSTPGDISTPHTPGMPGDSYDRDDNNANDSDWHTLDIEIQINDTHANGSYARKKGIIRDITGDTCRVELKESGDYISVPKDAVDPVHPTNKCQIKIIRGDMKGTLASLVGVDGEDGIVKIEFDITILDLHNLAIYHPRS
eukprot:TRINITY_DN1184_c0_g1_i1.p1 TRINITY_DN1184_c0_g1~~TRINITY_DN1184_c0_g1_i1.p1  ORF type:complete len:997 (-),score=365.73 TRINITY_DN1184_c0_g1_i1:156-3146(-)